MNDNLKSKDFFLAELIKVEVSFDQIVPGECLFVTAWWRNIGGNPSEKPLSCFLEAEFGHQRIEEIRDKYYRKYWNPYPSTNNWDEGEVWKTTCMWNFSPNWCGIFKINIGLCDEKHTPVEFIEKSNCKTKMAYIGDINISWGWGTPTVEKTRKPWLTEYNQLFAVQSKTTIADSMDKEYIEISSDVKAVFKKSQPVLLSLYDGIKKFEFEDIIPEFVLRDSSKNQYIYSTEAKIKVLYNVISQTSDKVCYCCKILCNEEEIAGIDLNYFVEGRKLIITTDNEWDKGGIDLLEVRVPSLISAKGRDVNMVDFFGGGRLINIENSLPVSYSRKYSMRNAAGLFDSEGILVFESHSLDDKMWISIKENNHYKTANIGFSIINKVAAESNVESIKVENNHLVELNFLDHGFGKPSWQAVARFLRKDLKGKNRDLYRRALLYKYLATDGPQPEQGRVKEDSPYGIKRLTKLVTLKKIFDDVKAYYNIFDGIPQVLYIGGFQKGGFDNNYPYLLEVEEKVGTIEELREGIIEGKKYNALIGIHDNFDSCMPGEHFDERIVCIDEKGELWKGWIWAAGMDYIVSPYKYSKTGLMQDRIKKIVELYGLNITNHLDVLSAELTRYDYDPKCPASADKSILGKYDIIDEFNKYGIDITSENLMHPFVGKIGHALWSNENRSAILFPGEKYIHLTCMVYHGVIGYFGPGGTKTEFLRSLLRANNYFIEDDHLDNEKIKWNYLQNMPVGLLYDKVIEDIIEERETTKVIYDEGTYVFVDFENMDYEVVVDGQLIAKNYSTFVPGFKDNTYLAYSAISKTLNYPLPKGISTTSKVKVVALTFMGEAEEVPFKIANGNIEIEMTAEVPVKITVG